MMDMLSIVLMAAAIGGGVFRAWMNGTLPQKQTWGDVVIAGVAGGTYTTFSAVPKDVTSLHAGLIMFAVSYLASDALQALVKSLVGRFTAPLIPKPVLLLPVLLATLAACATGAPEIVTPTHAASESLSDALATLKADTVIDLDAATTIAVAHGDAIAGACWPALKRFLTEQTGTPTPTVDQVKGVFSAWEKARVERLALEAKGAVGVKLPDYLKLGCAALLQDERNFGLRLAALIVSVAAK